MMIIIRFPVLPYILPPVDFPHESWYPWWYYDPCIQKIWQLPRSGDSERGGYLRRRILFQVENREAQQLMA